MEKDPMQRALDKANSARKYVREQVERFPEDDNVTSKTMQVAMSHLSDAQELISMGDLDEANVEINAVKKLLNDVFEDTSPRIQRKLAEDKQDTEGGPFVVISTNEQGQEYFVSDEFQRKSRAQHFIENELKIQYPKHKFRIKPAHKA